ncbi:FAD-dependent monooxygenase [Nocardia sp. 2]|uniref:FAD-dependent monooxygenase n=1 Tax=Nocardia acididurans TaxID=2802282 RepID=A0ABS1M8W9_9NOCA|nr:FAD-dependent monooxygenase [Nocardia acididurans]MBL1077082.1 FAD-dependent monooxygenase [Nocardia acididurans]
MATTILGGGIAGTALAAALARGGDKVTLYEQRPSGSGGGAFLFMEDRAHTALTALGVDPSALHAASQPIQGLDYTNSVGVHSARMGQGHRFWLRADLITVLRDFLETSGAETRFGTTVTEVRTEADTVVLHTADATPLPLTDTLVIAADGIDSVARAHLDPARTPVYAGDIVVYGMTTNPLSLPSPAAVLHFYDEITPEGKGATLGHVWTPTTNALWFLRIPRSPLPADDLGLRPLAEWSDTILEAAPANRALLETLLAHTDSVHVSNARNVPLDPAAAPTPPLLLIGDADHAITPAAGIGARDALEDAHAIHRALTTAASPAEAMANRRTQIRADRERAQRLIRQSTGRPASS